MFILSWGLFCRDYFTYWQRLALVRHFKCLPTIGLAARHGNNGQKMITNVGILQAGGWGMGERWRLSRTFSHNLAQFSPPCPARRHNSPSWPCRSSGCQWGESRQNNPGSSQSCRRDSPCCPRTGRQHWSVADMCRKWPPGRRCCQRPNHSAGPALGGWQCKGVHSLPWPAPPVDISSWCRRPCSCSPTSCWRCCTWWTEKYIEIQDSMDWRRHDTESWKVSSDPNINFAICCVSKLSHLQT